MNEATKELYGKYLEETLDRLFFVKHEKPEPNISEANIMVYRVEENKKYNFMDDKKNLLCKKWCDDARDFHEGYAAIKENGKWKFIDKTGKEINEEWYDDARDFHEGYATIKENGKWKFIDKTGKEMNEEWYDDVRDFHEGYAPIKKNGKWNFMDKQGNLLFKTWLNYDDVDSFCEGYAIVKDNDQYNLINKQGDLLFETWLNYTKVWNFHEGCLCVGLDYNNPINIEGQWRERIQRKYNFIDTTGKLIGKEWYDRTSSFSKGYAYVEKDYMNYFINKYGKVDFDFYSIKYSPEIAISNDKKIMMVILGDAEWIFVDLNGFEVKKNKIGKGFTLTQGNDKYKLKYTPLKIYGIRYTLCANGYSVCMYDRIKDEYIPISSLERIQIKDNFIIDEKNHKVYFIYENKMLDITDYYYKYLNSNPNYSITSGVDVIDESTFFLKNRSEIEALMLQRFEERIGCLNHERAKAIESEKEEEIKAAQESENERAKQIQQEEDKVNKLITSLKNSLDTIKDLTESEYAPNKRTAMKDLIVEYGSIKIINSKYIEILKLIDISMIRFDDVLIEGINFNGTNTRIEKGCVDPQTVANKSLKNCNFERIPISPFADFNGVDIRGMIFTVEEGSFLPISIKDAIYDETTICNGVPLSEVLGSQTFRK